jgi:hypothetical protein
MVRPGKFRKWKNSNEMKLYNHDFIASLFVLLFGVGLAVLVTDIEYKHNFFIGLFVASVILIFRGVNNRIAEQRSGRTRVRRNGS